MKGGLFFSLQNLLLFIKCCDLLDHIFYLLAGQLGKNRQRQRFLRGFFRFRIIALFAAEKLEAVLKMQAQRIVNRRADAVLSRCSFKASLLFRADDKLIIDMLAVCPFQGRRYELQQPRLGKELFIQCGVLLPARCPRV